MGTYPRLGSSLLVSKLASDPMGALHRGVLAAGGRFERHVIVRSFSDDLLQGGLAARLDEARQVAALLSGEKVFGQRYRIEGGDSPHALWELVPGRSLAQLLEKGKQEQVPFSLDLALTVVQGLALGILQMQAKGVSHGLISPHSVWVGFDGTLQLMDAPFAALAKDLLAEAPSAMRRLAPYLQGPDNGPLQQDLFALGALFYELLTFEALPVGADLGALLDETSLQAAQEDAPLPIELRAFLDRVLDNTEPYASVESFQAGLEHMLYQGETNPSTFSLAFFMHTQFREEKDREAAAMQAEQSADYSTPVSAGGPLPPGISLMEPFEHPAEVQAGQKSSKLLIGGGLIALVLLGLAAFAFGRRGVDPHASDPAGQKRLEDLEKQNAKLERQKAELEAKVKGKTEKVSPAEKISPTEKDGLAENPSVVAKPPSEKPKAAKKGGEPQQFQLELERQQKAAEKRLNERRLAEQKQGQ